MSLLNGAHALEQASCTCITAASLVAPWWLLGGSLVVAWWLLGGSSVAPWWLLGGSLVAPWWLLRGSLSSLPLSPRFLGNG